MNHILRLSGSTLLCLVAGGSSACSSDVDSNDETSDSVSKGKGVVQFMQRGDEACALLEDGKVYCYGLFFGRVAGGDRLGLTADPKRFVVGSSKSPLPPGIAISETSNDACILHKNGTVSCWGYDGYIEAKIATPVQGVTDAVAIDGLCALTRSGKVTCWEPKATPATRGSYKAKVVAGVDDVVQISSGSNASCALQRDGQVLCWGKIATVIDQNVYFVSTPTIVKGLDDVAEIRVSASATGGATACARKSDGHVVCWGSKAINGGGVLDMNKDKAIEVEGIDDAIKVELYQGSACAIRKTGTVSCWGFHPFGGDAKLSPYDVPKLAGVRDLRIAWAGNSGGLSTACAVTKKKDVHCWGQTTYSLWGTLDIGYTTQPARVEAFDAF